MSTNSTHLPVAPNGLKDPAEGADAPFEVDLDRIAAAVREILQAIGEDPERDGLVDTPVRVARMYQEIFAGLHEDPDRHLQVTFEAGHDEMVMVRDIPLFSVCEHHLLPWFGEAHVAYIPNADGRRPSATSHSSAAIACTKSRVTPSEWLTSRTTRARKPGYSRSQAETSED